MDQNARLSFVFSSYIYIYIYNEVCQFNKGEICSLALPSSHICSLPCLDQSECFYSHDQQVFYSQDQLMVSFAVVPAAIENQVPVMLCYLQQAWVHLKPIEHLCHNKMMITTREGRNVIEKYPPGGEEITILESTIQWVCEVCDNVYFGLGKTRENYKDLILQSLFHKYSHWFHCGCIIYKPYFTGYRCHAGGWHLLWLT